MEALRARWWPPSESGGKKAREAAAERGLQLLKKARPSSCQRRGCWPPLAVKALRDEMALAEETLAVATSSKSVQVSVLSKVSTSATRLWSVVSTIECKMSNGDVGKVNGR